MSKKKTMKVLKDPDLIDIIQDEFKGMGIVEEVKNRMIIFLVCLSALLLKEPIGIILSGGSSSGKSWLIKWISKNLPEATENIWVENENTGEREERTDWKDGFGCIEAIAITEASIHNITRDNKDFFKNKILIMEELPANPSDDLVRAQQMIRILVSEGKLTRVKTVRGRSFATTVKGHPVLICCDATLQVDDQLMNRCLLLNPDEGIKQNKNVVFEQGKHAEKPWLADNIMKKSSLLSTIHKHLKPYEVLNLWGTDIAKFMLSLSSDQQIRRTNKLVIRMVEVYTLLFQHQRQIVVRENDPNRKYLLTTREDVIETLELLAPVIQQTLTKVLGTALSYLEDIKNEENMEFWSYGDDGDSIGKFPKEFTYSEFGIFKKKHRKSVYPHLKSLAEIGVLTLNTSSKPYGLKLNLAVNSPEDVFCGLKDMIKDSFPEKELPDGLVMMSSS